MSTNLEGLMPDDNYLAALPGDVWLMDNHKWALSVWARSHAGFPRKLLHADHHWDGVDLFYGDDSEQVALAKADLAELERRIVEEDRVQYDAFIAPAVRRGYFDQVHFYCTQKDDWDKGLDPDLCAEFGVSQTLHASVESFAAVPLGMPMVFDLCLDLFNESDKFYGSSLWSDATIQAFLDATRHLVEAASVVTVSMSFGYSGTQQDTQRLAQLVVPQLIAWRAPR